MSNITFKYLLLSDLHLGNSLNPAVNIIRNLDSFFIKNRDEIVKVDVIFLLGDIFDKLLASESGDLRLILKWITRLLLFCKKYGIILRVLRGTVSHDYKQIELFDSIVETMHLDKVNYKYFDKLDIEYLAKYDKHILYLPDNWSESAEVTYQDVLAKLEEHQLEKVDIIMMHGAFKYQVPQIESEAFHTESNYTSIVNDTVNSGHIHDSSQAGKILVPGSFDRLTQIDANQDKGGMIVTIEDNEFTFKFLKNPNPLVFKTIDVTDLDIDEIDKEVKRVNSRNKLAFIRFLTKNREDKISFTLLAFREKYPNLRFDSIYKDNKKKEEKKTLFNKERKSNIINLDSKTIRRLIEEELDAKEEITEEDKLTVLKELSELIDN